MVSSFEEEINGNLDQVTSPWLYWSSLLNELQGLKLHLTVLCLGNKAMDISETKLSHFRF